MEDRGPEFALCGRFAFPKVAVLPNLRGGPSRIAENASFDLAQFGFIGNI